jgi:hypothetical protein
VTGGPAHLFDDGRIHWLLGMLGEVCGWNVFELGPLEGGHTYMLCNAGARVTAVEMHRRAYLRCLCARELLRYEGATFLLGDGVETLKATSSRLDLVVASGVLYHLEDPLALLEAASARSDRLFLWTHVWDAEVAKRRPEVAGQFTRPWRQVFRGGELTGMHRRYDGEHASPAACTGPAAGSVWMTRGSLLEALRALGFSKIETAFEEPDHSNGPALALLARR